MNLNLYGSDQIEYPAQVCANIRKKCQALLEEQYKKVIHQNFYEDKYFPFELDQTETGQLLSLFETSASSTFSENKVKISGNKVNNEAWEDGSCAIGFLTTDKRDSNSKVVSFVPCWGGGQSLARLGTFGMENLDADLAPCQPDNSELGGISGEKLEKKLISPYQSPKLKGTSNLACYTLDGGILGTDSRVTSASGHVYIEGSNKLRSFSETVCYTECGDVDVHVKLREAVQTHGTIEAGHCVRSAVRFIEEVMDDLSSELNGFYVAFLVMGFVKRGKEVEIYKIEIEKTCIRRRGRVSKSTTKLDQPGFVTCGSGSDFLNEYFSLRYNGDDSITKGLENVTHSLYKTAESDQSTGGAISIAYCNTKTRQVITTRLSPRVLSIRYFHMYSSRTLFLVTSVSETLNQRRFGRRIYRLFRKQAKIQIVRVTPRFNVYRLLFKTTTDCNNSLGKGGSCWARRHNIPIWAC